MMKVDKVMSAEPTCCTQLQTAKYAANLMKKQNIGFIPIVENENSSKIVGLVTDRDLCMVVVATGKDPDSVKLKDCMSSKLICCGSNDEIEDVLKLMLEHNVRRVPVLDERKQVEGIVSQADIALSGMPI